MPIQFRPYQIPIFQDNTTSPSSTGPVKSAKAASSLRGPLIASSPVQARLVTVLSNSRENGIEFADKCQAICAEDGATFEASSSIDLEILVIEIRIRVQGPRGRL